MTASQTGLQLVAFLVALPAAAVLLARTPKALTPASRPVGPVPPPPPPRPTSSPRTHLCPFQGFDSESEGSDWDSAWDEQRERCYLVGVQLKQQRSRHGYGVHESLEELGRLAGGCCSQPCQLQQLPSWPARPQRAKRLQAGARCSLGGRLMPGQAMLWKLGGHALDARLLPPLPLLCTPRPACRYCRAGGCGPHLPAAR